MIRLLAIAAIFLAVVPAAAPSRTPVLLELFTSEGCSDCPPADRLLETFDRTQPITDADLIVLSEHVDYWNHDGWVDRFSSPQFTARQQDYCERLHVPEVYTPQLVVDGRAQLVGSNGRQAQVAIEEAAHAGKAAIGLSGFVRDGSHVSVHVEAAAPPRSAELYLALADASDASQVKRGENAGRSLEHVAVVRTLRRVASVKAGEAFAGNVSGNLPSGAGASGVRAVVFLQERNSGRILGVGCLR